MSQQDKIALLSQIQNRFSYDPETGKIYYKKRENITHYNHKTWNMRFADKEVIGWLNNNGYYRLSFDCKLFYFHQIAFICMKGYIPEEVDHIDKNKTNNIWSNLREADRINNSCNSFKRKTNRSGLKGVSWAKSNNCWRMDITFNKKKYHSYHATKEEAYEAYCIKSSELHKEFGCVD